MALVYLEACYTRTDGFQLCIGWGTLSSDRTALY